MQIIQRLINNCQTEIQTHLITHTRKAPTSSLVTSAATFACMDTVKPGKRIFQCVVMSAHDVCARMTLEEKADTLADVNDWYLRRVTRLGIPPIRPTDCGHGVTLCGDRPSPGTYYPRPT
jgi:hypothetical protein